MITGSIFTSGEFLLYYFTLSNQNSFHFTRFLTPIHIVTTTILSIGIYYFFKVNEETNEDSIRIFIFKFIPIFILSWAIHSFWNMIPQMVSFYVYTRYPVEKYFMVINIIENDYFNFVLFILGLLLNITILFILFSNSKSNLGIELDSN